MMSPPKPKKISRYLGLSAIAAGACFLFDPFFSVFDFLPDACGYFLIYIGLYRLADLDDRMASARRAAKWMALAGVARFLLMLLSFGLVSPDERPAFILLTVFVLAVVDILCMIPLWRHVGNGLLYLGARHEATALFRLGGSRRARSEAERYISSTLFFFVAREVTVVLPELTVLTHQSGGADGYTASLYDYISLWRLTGAAISLVIGVIWLVRTFVFFHRIKSDKPFVEHLHRKYETEVLVRHDLFAMRAIKGAMLSLTVATVFSLDFYMEGVDMLPDVLAGVCFCICIALLRRYVGKEKALPAMASAVVYSAMAAVTGFFQFQKIRLDDVLDPTTAAIEEAAGTMSVLQTLTSVLFFVTFVLILRTLYGLARLHTGVRNFRDADATGTGAGPSYAAERTEAIHLGIRKKLVAVGAFAALAAVSTLVQWIFIPTLPDVSFVGNPDTMDTVLFTLYDGLREAYWMIDVIIGGILTGLTVHAGSEISEQMDYTYLMK